jgi:hypothetical protein
VTSDESSNFWTSMPGVVTAVTGLLTAVAGLLLALGQLGVIGGNDSSAAPAPTPSVSLSPIGSPVSSQSPTEAVDGGNGAEGDALAGTWRGTATSSDGDFDIELQVFAPCELRKPCGTISVSSAPCAGRVTLWRVKGPTYTLYVDKFSPDSSSDCTPGAGEYFQVVDDSHLSYSTGYSDAAAVLTRAP